ncbi:MAG: hypothetical protein CMN32_08625 [Saprospirales bacterium]|nr:hypothetical protein [Saprospirales bacterium]
MVSFAGQVNSLPLGEAHPNHKTMINISVKANAVTNLTDARYFAARGVDWMGFVLEPGQEDAVSKEQFETIRGWVDGVKFVGEFDLTPADEILALATELKLDAVQVGMFAERDPLMKLKGLTVIKEVVIAEDMEETDILEHFLDYSPFCEYFLLDLRKSGITWTQIENKELYPLSMFQNLCKHNKVFLDIEMSAANLPAIIGTLKPYGICVTGGSEEKVGYKSFDELDEIFDLFEMA